MIRVLLTIFIGAAILSCAGQQVFPVPADLPIPKGWNPLSHETFGQSLCPQISGKFSEPPARHSSPGSQFSQVTYDQYGYVSVLPFHSAERMRLNSSGAEIEPGEFQIIQKDDGDFVFRDASLKFEIFETGFYSKRGHFRCRTGKMYFPLITRFGADQHRDFNDQHQHVLSMDVEGNLILIRITGPYKKTFFTRTANFEYDYMRYQRVE